MKNFIYIRNTLDWESIHTIEDFLDANKSSRQLIQSWLPILKKLIEEWNKCFNINYFKFRNILKKLTIQNIETIPNVIVINKYEKQILDDTDEFMLFATDDDDWVSPTVFHTVSKYLNNEHAIVWPFGFLTTHMEVTHMPIHDIKWIYTNNTIITKQGYNLFKKRCKECDFLENHREADNYAQLPDCKIRLIPNLLSVYNQSPASATILWGHNYNNKFSNQNIKSIVNKYKGIPDLPADLDWSKKYIEETWKTIGNLTKIRKRFI